MSTSVNMILHMYIWFEGWFDDWVEGGLKLSLKGFQTKLFFFYFRSDDLKWLEARFEGWFDQFERTINILC